MSYVDTIHKCVAKLGGDVGAALRPAQDLRARATGLDGALTRLRAQGEGEYAAVVAAVAAGRLDPAEAPGKVAAAQVWGFDSPSSKAVVSAIAACHRQADAAEIACGPAIFAACQELIKGVVAESVQLVAGLPPTVIDEKSAFVASRGGLKHFESWQRLHDLYGVWALIHEELVPALERAQWIPAQPPSVQRNIRGGPAPRPFVAYTHPHRLRAEFANAPDERKLAVAWSSAAGPGLFSWADGAADRWHAAQRKFDAESGLRFDDTPSSQYVTVAR